MRVLLLVVALAATSFADVTRPAYLGLTEVRDGRFEVTWRVPRRGDRVLAIRARLPDVFRPITEPVVKLESDVQTTTWTVEAKPWELSGAIIAVEGPGTSRVDVMVRFEFRDGTVVARILPPGTTECSFPRRASARSPAREIQDSAIAGVQHAFTTFAYLVFLLGLALCGSVRIVAGALAFYLAGQFGGIAFGLQVPEAFANALLGIGGAVAAAAAVRSDVRHLGIIALVCGVAHGAVLPGGYVGAIGADGAGLLVAIAFVRIPWKPVIAYVAGTAGVALALIEVTAPSAAITQQPQQSVLLAPAAKQADTPASAPVASATDAPLQVFLEVTPFETRVEWVAKVAALRIANPDDLAVSEQAAFKERVREIFTQRLAVSLGGILATPADTRIDFVTREAGGVLERVEPVVERIETALVGVALSFPTREPPEKVVVRWQSTAGVTSVPAIVVDPQNTRSTVLDAENPELTWSDALAMPPVRAVAVRERIANVSLLSIGLFVLGLIAAVRRFGRGGVVGARMLLAGACLTAPYVQIPIPLPGDATPGEAQAEEVVEALLTNIYRGLEQQDESAAYDRLRVSVTEDALRPIYLEQRRVLELGKRGGARARVDSVEVVHVQSIEPVEGGRFRARVVWEAGGFVVHYGHRHFRQNSYEAEFELVPEDGSWKFARLEVVGKERMR